MLTKQNLIYMAALISLLVLLSCNTTENKKNVMTTKNNDTIINNIKDVEKTINITNVKIDTNSSINMYLYKIGVENERIPGPSDYYLIATFKILDIDTTKFKVINSLKEPLDKKSIFYKEWLPNSVVKTLFTKATFKEAKVYSAELFYKSPYLQGFFILQNDSTIYLQMQTK